MPQNAFVLEEEALLSCESCCLKRSADFAALHKRAVELVCTPPKDHRILFSQLAFEMLSVINKEIAGPSYPAPVFAALEYMRRNIYRKVTISELSAEAGVCASHLSRLCKAHLKAAPLSYFNTLKIKHAAELLRRTRKPVNEIAAGLGYKEAAYFSNQFRKIMGFSPRKFRTGEHAQHLSDDNASALVMKTEFAVLAQ
jgi:AraC-like DNA-binding protein